MYIIISLFPAHHHSTHSPYLSFIIAYILMHSVLLFSMSSSFTCSLFQLIIMMMAHASIVTPHPKSGPYHSFESPFRILKLTKTTHLILKRFLKIWCIGHIYITILIILPSIIQRSKKKSSINFGMFKKFSKIELLIVDYYLGGGEGFPKLTNWGSRHIPVIPTKGHIRTLNIGRNKLV